MKEQRVFVPETQLHLVQEKEKKKKHKRLSQPQHGGSSREFRRSVKRPECC